jgi:hypothetical protein
MSTLPTTPHPVRRTGMFALATSEAEPPLAAAIAAAPSLALLDAMARAVWSRLAKGALDEAEAQGLAELAAARRRALKGGGEEPRSDSSVAARPPLPRWRYPAPRKPRRPDRAASLERRRRLAASGPMPPALAARFTTGELAALKIVADEIFAKGACALALGAIAARAGVSETTARNALRAAARDGLLTIEERPRRGLPNLTNIVRMISREWRDWLDRRPLRGGGCRNAERTGRRVFGATTGPHAAAHTMTTRPERSARDSSRAGEQPKTRYDDHADGP